MSWAALASKKPSGAAGGGVAAPSKTAPSAPPPIRADGSVPLNPMMEYLLVSLRGQIVRVEARYNRYAPRGETVAGRVGT